MTKNPKPSLNPLKKPGRVGFRVASDIRPFLISGIRPDIRFRLPVISVVGYPARKKCLKLKTEDK